MASSSAGDNDRANEGVPAPTVADREEALLRQRAIGKRLKPLWDDITKEPLPDDFLSLLDGMAPDDDDDGTDKS